MRSPIESAASRDRALWARPEKSLVALCLVALIAATAGCSTIRERVHLSRGTKLYKAQKYEGAIGEFRKILEFKRDSWHGNYMISVSYLALYHPGSVHEKDLEYADLAVASFEKLLALPAPDEATKSKVRRFYVNLLMQAEKLDKAIAFFEDLLRGDENNPELLAEIAQIYAKKNDFPKAAEYYQKRADADPTNKDAWYTIGVICWERSYKQGALISNAERSEVIQKGLAAMSKALTLDAEHTSALSYTNLLYREQAKTLLEVGDAQAAGGALLKADEYQKKAMAILRSKAATGAAPHAKAGA